MVVFLIHRTHTSSSLTSLLSFWNCEIKTKRIGKTGKVNLDLVKASKF